MRLFAALLILGSAAGPSYAGRSGLAKAVARSAGVRTSGVYVPRALNYALGIGVGAGIIVPRLSHSSLPSPIPNMMAPSIGATLSAIPEAPTLRDFELVHGVKERSSSLFPGPVPQTLNAAVQKKIAASERMLAELADQPIDVKEARKKSETLADTAREVQQEGGANYGAMFDNFGRDVPTAKESGVQTVSSYAGVKGETHAIRLPTQSNYRGMITALRDKQTFQQAALAQLKAVINKAVSKQDLRFMSQIALLSYHDPRAHALALEGIQRLKRSGDAFAIPADGTLQSIEHYRSRQDKIPGRSDMIPTNLLSHVNFYSRRR